ncbi:MAG: twin-arginine translocation signal domain-containing protein, partial [Anaerolineae bacterium]|nr:twin-arginine translocation signal domain-containing protein [Anaerolineae bacterium]
MTGPSNQSKHKISRREFLRLTAAAAAGVVAIGPDVIASPAGDVASTHNAVESSSEQSVPSVGVQTYNEAPMLAALVQRGLLPPVDQRLPTNPCVIPALHQTGKYDSVMNRAFKGVSDRWGPTKMIDHAFVWYDKDLNLVPRLCESWESNTDASEWTFHLRQGTRWSDGVEFTSDDIVWWYQYVLTDKDIFSTPPSQWTAGGEVMTVQAPDKYTVKMSFIQPNVLFIYQVTRGR